MSGLAPFFEPFLDGTGRRTKIDYDTSLTSISKNRRHESDDTSNLNLTQSEWRKEYSKILAIYVERRLFCETAAYSKEEKRLFKRIFGTPIDVVPKAPNTGHHATSVAQLKLDNAKLSLSVAPILLASRMQYCSEKVIEGPQLSDVPTAFFQKGPAFPVYKYVVSMQIVEEDVVEKRQLSKNTRNIFGNKLRRVMVFFYDEYAMRLRQIMELARRNQQQRSQQQNGNMKSTGIALTLKNIPSKCIFPWKIRDPCGVLQGMDSGLLADYCVCIGGKSKIHQNHTLQSNNDSMFVHLESADMEIRTTIFRDRTNIEFMLTQESVKFLDGNGSTSLEPLQVQPSSYMNVGPLLQQIEKEKEIEDRIFTAKSLERRLLGMKRKNLDSVQESDVQYMPLIDIPEFLDSKRGKQRKEMQINIHAAVLSFTSPRYTKKRDLMMVVTIFDDSLPLPTENSASDMATGLPTQMTLTIFAKKIEDLPNLKYAGDIIRCHDILPEMKDGSIYLTAWHWNSIAVARPSENIIKWFESNSGARLTRGKFNNWDFQELDTEHAPTDLDNLKARKLWTFARKRISDSPNIRAEYKTTISDLINVEEPEMVYKDLTVMVCSVTEYPTEDQDMYSPRAVVRIWDGTGPPRSDAFITDNGTDMSSEPNLLCLESILETCHKMKENKDGFSLPSENEELISVTQFDPKCLCGMVVNLEIWENTQWQLIKEALPGTFVRLRQIGVSTCKKYPQLKVLRTCPSSCIMFVPNSTYEVKRLVLSHQLRIKNNHPYNPMSACLKLKLPARIMNKDMFSRTVSTIGPQSLMQCILGPVPSMSYVRFYVAGLKLMSENDGYDELSPRMLLSVHDDIIDMEVIAPKHVFRDLVDLPIATRRSSKNDSHLNQYVKNMIGKQYDGCITSLSSSGKTFFILSKEPSLVFEDV